MVEDATPPGGSLFIESTPRPEAIPPTAPVPGPGGGVTRSAEDAGASGPAGPSLGVVAGRYELEAVLGQGGMGAVYRCFDRQLKRTAALKMIRADKLEEREHRARREARFLHEARSMARLQHPGCVQIYDVGVNADGAPFLVMELVEGESLWDVIQNEELSPGRAALLLHQVAGALHAAHELGIVHRDVKPHNIIVSDKGA